MKMKYFAPLLLLTASSVPAIALPGEASAIIARCGAPTADTMGTSEVTGQPMRTLTYSDIRLNFEPLSGGWSFTSGWNNHIPMNDLEVGKKMPCFTDALTQVAHAPAPAMDPTTQEQIGSTSPTNRGTFGINNLWVIVLLIGVIAIFGVILPRSSKIWRGPKMANRPFRRPGLVISRFRRRPRVIAADEV